MDYITALEEALGMDNGPVSISLWDHILNAHHLI
jgi:hypothetical protein